MNKTKELVASFFQLVGSWINQNADKYQYIRIPEAQTEVGLKNKALEPERDYFSLTLAEMFLTQSRAWFTDQYPAVHSAVFLKFADRERVSFSNVSRPPEEKLSKGVYINYPLVQMLPYNGGTVEIELALLALKGTNQLALAIDVLQDFAGLVTAPLGQALTVAEKVTGGIQRLIDTTRGQVHLGAHQAYTAGGTNPLTQGYYAVVMSADSTLAERLYVKDDRLYLKNNGQVNPYSAADYVLFKIESTPNRPDWRLSYIEKPLKEAQRAYVLGETSKAEDLKKMAILAAMEAPDLTYEDRWDVIGRIEIELQRLASPGRSALGGELVSLEELMAEPVPPAPPRKGPPTYQTVFGG